MQTELEGILVVNKEGGLTSHDVVARLRRVFKMRRIGHCGTLDPLATGVLVVCLGRLTRLNEWISDADKEYLATFCLGAQSNTGDRDGTVQAIEFRERVDIISLKSALKTLTGTYDQVPPAFSAIKVNGVPSYRLARQDIAVPLKARKISINTIEVLEYHWPMVRLRIACSKGTYIRSLAMDLGEKLGCGAYVEALHRTKVGPLGENRAWTLGEIATQVSVGKLQDLFVPPAQCLSDLPHLVLDEFELKRFGNGQKIKIASFQKGQTPQDFAAVFDKDECLYGIGRWEIEGSLLKPVKVLKLAS